MEIKDFKQALELQKELSASLAANIEKLGKDKAPPVAETIKEQEQLLAQARAALKNSKKRKRWLPNAGNSGYKNARLRSSFCKKDWKI